MLESIREYAILKIELTLNPDEELQQQMKDICEFFIEQNKPHSFAPGNNDVIKHEKGFEKLCAALEESGVNMRSLSIFEFYSRIEHFETKYSKIKKHGSNQ